MSIGNYLVDWYTGWHKLGLLLQSRFDPKLTLKAHIYMWDKSAAFPEYWRLVCTWAQRMAHGMDCAAYKGGWSKAHRAPSLTKSCIEAYKGWLLLVKTSGKQNLAVPSSYKEKFKFWGEKAALCITGGRKERLFGQWEHRLPLLDQSERRFTLKRGAVQSHVEKHWLPQE